MTPYIASIYMFGGNFAIAGFAMCQGQILSISQNTALFSLIGTYYGGNGTSTFALPDLRGRVAIGSGAGTGLSDYVIGEATGVENTTLNLQQLPLHNHLVNAYNENGSTSSPAGCVFAEVKTGSGPHAVALNFYNAASPTIPLNQQTIGIAGGSLPFSILQPTLALNYIIALKGNFPARN